MKTPRLTRRGFLLGAGITAGGLMLGVRVGLPLLRLQLAETFDEGSGATGRIEAEPTIWLHIAPDNRVTLSMPKVEMGQGVHTALGQVAAEELDIAWEQLSVEHASTATGPLDTFGTTGSLSVRTVYQPLREAAATLRAMLIAEAARHWGVPASDVDTEAGEAFLRTAPEQRLAYGDIVRMANGAWTIPDEPPPLKSPDRFRLIGRSMPRVDFRAKLTGKAVYGLDKRMDGMLYGAAAYPPTVAGRLKRAEAGDAPNQPGVVQVVTREGFAGVVATSRQAAEAALGALNLEWDEGPRLSMADIEAQVHVGNGTRTIIQKEGDTDGAFSDRSDITAEYRTPLAAHAHLEPQAALVHVRPDGVQAWVATQTPAFVRSALADALGRDEEEIEVIPTYLGGGFGRKAGTEAAVEAALLSEASGRPVHVGWTRTKEFRAGYLRPPTHHQLRGVLDESGKIAALEHQQASADVAFGFVPKAFQLVAGADFGATRGARMFYNVPNLRTVAWRTPLPFRTGWWRGLGLLANTFAIESFMDELAHAAGQDPLEFRLRHLPADEWGDRLRLVLEEAATLAGWGNPRAGHALGVALCRDAGTAVAQVADISLDDDGSLRVHRVVCAIDPGLPINPDGVKAQTEGAIIMGLGSTLLEEVRIEDGRILHANFDTYPLLTMKDAPDIAVSVLRSGNTPFGVGEPPIGPVAAAVANAFYTLTGERLRRLPLRLPSA